MIPAGFELKIPASKRPQTHALDRAVTGVGSTNIKAIKVTVIMRLAGHVGRVENVLFKQICVGKPKEKNQFLDIDLHGRKILNWN
jgi:hypothetical protein